MAARKESGAETKSGKERSRSKSSRGRPRMVEAVSGEGLTGLVGFASESKALMRDNDGRGNAGSKMSPHRLV
jgi:hypothetical protein